MPTFIANRFSEGNHIHPTSMIIESSTLTLYKRKIFGSQRFVINHNDIASISIVNGIIFSQIHIESFGGRVVIANGFDKDDARLIRELLGF